MRYLFGLMCVCALSALPVLGCTETTGAGGTGGTAGDGGAGGDGGTAGDGGTGGAPETRMYVMMVTGFDPDGEHPALEGVEVCESDTDNCDTTNEFGRAVLQLPANREIAITMVKQGYGSWITGDVSDDTAQPVGTRRLYTDAQLMAVAAQLGITYPWEGGIVGLVRNPSEMAGVTFTPVGSTAQAVDESFYYNAATEEYSLDLDATTSVAESWLLPLGAGGFTEVTPGEQQFEFGGTAGDCEVSWAWPGDGPNRIRVPVRDGYRTYGSMICNGQ